MAVILADIRAGQHVVTEINDISTVAAIILLTEVEDLRLEPVDEQAMRAGSAPRNS